MKKSILLFGICATALLSSCASTTVAKQEISDEFKNKFIDLLNEYGAGISFDSADCSDTYGIYDPKIVVTIRDPDNFKNEIVVIESKGYAL